ncbi:hypothetical protein [Magnetospirillum sp. SS-4]|uniref:hypothetical protein n=1 Tax=Magnetospirillum sp. SS-4 TaxID=2681465 RepID=UPI00157387FE|nr:hypothetical protein [Magnetospirillum sp. SS-4]
MAVELVPYGYPEPVSYRQRVADARLPSTDGIPREVGRPTPYVNTGGLVLAQVISKSTEAVGLALTEANAEVRASYQGYGSTGAATTDSSSASRGTRVDITA